VFWLTTAVTCRRSASSPHLQGRADWARNVSQSLSNYFKGNVCGPTPAVKALCTGVKALCTGVKALCTGVKTLRTGVRAVNLAPAAEDQ
jgi:hypothetical protein